MLLAIVDPVIIARFLVIAVAAPVLLVGLLLWRLARRS